MASYLDNLSEYTSKAQIKIAALALEAATIIDNGGAPYQQIDNINWFVLLLTGANDTTQNETLRLQLLTLLVDNARLNEVPLVNVFGLYQSLIDGTITATEWGLITGDINNQNDLIAKFNTYLPLVAGTSHLVSGTIYFGADGLGIDTFNEGDTLNIGASAGVLQFGVDAEAKFGNIAEGAWLASPIAIAKGGTGQTSVGTAFQVLRTNAAANGTEWATITIPSLTGYIKADGTIPMTADLRFPDGKGIDTTSSGAICIGANNATAVQIFPTLTVNTIAAGLWNGTRIGLAYGGTGAALTAPSNSSFFIYDSGTSKFATIGDNLSFSGGIMNLASALTNVDWRGSTIGVSYGGTGLSTIGAEGTVLTVVSGAPAWTAFTALTNPMTTLGDMIYGDAFGVPTRLIGNTTSTNKFLRSVSSGAPSWQTLVAADIPTIAQSQVSGLTTALANKLGTGLNNGYIFVGNAANAAAQLAMSGDATLSNTGVITISNAAVTFAKMQNITYQTLMGRWSAGDGEPQEITIGSGLTLSGLGVLTSGGLVNPMTTAGDLIVGGAGGDPTRLAIGANTYVLTSNGTTAVWAAAASGGGNVVGPGPTVTNGNFAVYNGTGGLTIGQPSNATLSTSGIATFTSIQVTGTGGNGHIHFRQQATQPSGIANYNLIYALPSGTNGFGFSVGAAGFASSLIFGATVARTYTLPDLSGTVALLANPASFTTLTATTSLTVGTASSSAGDVVFQNASNAFTQTIRGTNPSASIVYLLPTTAPTAGQALVSTAPSAGVATLSWSTISGSGVTTVGSFSGSSQTNGASISSTTITFGPADGTNPGMVSTGAQTIAGAKTFTSNILFSGSAAAPTLTSRSVGTRVVLNGTLSSTVLDYAFGIGSSTLWATLGTSSDSFIIYAPISSVVTSVFSITVSAGMSFNGSSLTFGTSTTSTNVRSGSTDQGIISRNFINLGSGGGTAGPAAIAASWASRSLGTRLIVQASGNPAQADMAIGYNTNEFWHSLFSNSSTFSFAWYGLTSKIMTLQGDGSLGLGVAPTAAFLSIAAGTTSKAQMNFAGSTAPSSPVNGDFWFDGTDVKIRVGGVTKTFTII